MKKLVAHKERQRDETLARIY